MPRPRRQRAFRKYGFHFWLACSLRAQKGFWFEEDIQRPIHHTEVRSLFHPGFERSEDLIGGHWIVYCHFVAERPPSPGCFQNILGRDLPVFNHGYSTRTALTLPAVSAGNASFTTVRTPGCAGGWQIERDHAESGLTRPNDRSLELGVDDGNPCLVFPLELVVAGKLAVGQWD